VTTSRLLSTGVDVQTCRLIVLDRTVGSMTEFKQIVGRGTRVHEDTRKFYFTLIDFRGATSHFADPEFDGEPAQIYEPGNDDPLNPPDDALPPQDDEEPIPLEPTENETIIDGEPPDISIQTGAERRGKIYVDGVSATIIAERVEYLDEQGRLVTESLRDLTRNALKRRFASLDDFLKRWKGAERKQAIIEELEYEGLILDPLADEVGKDLDPFDLICHVAFADAFRANARFYFNHLPRLTTRPDHIKQLRQTILDLAVRGKLVPQNPNDEQASELLKRAREHKEQVALRGTTKRQQPSKPLSPDEKIFASPPGWEWTRWSAVSHWITYGFTRPMPHTKEGVPIVTAKNVSKCRIDFHDVHFTDLSSFEQLSLKDKPSMGDILLTKDGAIGRAAWVREDYQFCINQSVAAIWLSGIEIDRDFLVLFIHSDIAQTPIQEAASGSAIKHISITHFARMPLVVPPLAEQRRIVAKVDELMALCDRLEASLAAAETDSRRLLEAVLHEALAPAADHTLEAVA
jgi:Type I restriction modification DNA specificity domain/EcoEI R protein C-terminal